MRLKFHSMYEGSGPGTTRFYLNQADFQDVSSPDDADILVFNGGADIATEIYGQQPIQAGIPLRKTARDRFECDVFEKFPDNFKLGICRGAQLLNCLNGGTLWQHVNNHGYTHDILDIDSGKTYSATSTHHQMMVPSKLGTVLAIASESTMKMMDGDERNKIDPDLDVEIVWYPKTRSLCIQGHPEYVPGSAFANYCLNLIKDHYDVKVQ